MKIRLWSMASVGILAVVLCFSGWASAAMGRVTNSLGMDFVWIEPGEYLRGSPDHEPGRGSSELQHRVILTNGFYLQTTEVTQGQWEAVMGSNPSRFEDCGDNCPVEQVSWNDVQEFISRLNRKESTDRYRLPTEAEWEYAARAGSTNRFHFGDDEARLGEYAWYHANAGRRTRPVATKLPNAWGLYDMYGNVSEWVNDWWSGYEWDPGWSDDGYPSGYVTDPSGPSSPAFSRVNRGGNWFSRADHCRSAFRTAQPPDDRFHSLGFRLARTP